MYYYDDDYYCVYFSDDGAPRNRAHQEPKVVVQLPVLRRGCDDMSLDLLAKPSSPVLQDGSHYQLQPKRISLNLDRRRRKSDHRSDPGGHRGARYHSVSSNCVPSHPSGWLCTAY